MDGLFQFGIGLIQRLQSLSPGLDGVMKGFTFLGTIDFFILLIPLIYWCIDQSLGLRVLFTLLLVDSFGNYFKHLFHQPRPYWIGDVKALSSEPSYGMPSSHASNTLAVWGMIGIAIKKTWTWIAIVILLLIIGISRLYLGMHFPHDVLIGWLLGLLVLVLFLKYEGPFMLWWQRKNSNAQILLGFIFSVMLILIGLLVVDSISGIDDPSGWAPFNAEARDVSHYFTLGGFLFGAVAGSVLAQRYVQFSLKGSLLVKAARYLLGMAGLIGIYLGLDLLFALLAPDASVAGYLLRYIRYSCVSLWGMLGAPWLFVKIGLANKQ